MKDWPQGMVFTVGLARTVMTAMKRYIEEEGHSLLETQHLEERAASG